MAINIEKIMVAINPAVMPHEKPVEYVYFGPNSNLRYLMASNIPNPVMTPLNKLYNGLMCNWNSDKNKKYPINDPLIATPNLIGKINLFIIMCCFPEN